MTHMIKLLEKLMYRETGKTTQGFRKIYKRWWARWMTRFKWFDKWEYKTRLRIIKEDRKQLEALYRKHCSPYQEGDIWYLPDHNMEAGRLREEYSKFKRL